MGAYSVWEERTDGCGARALARRALAARGDPGRLCRAEPGGAGARVRRNAPATAAGGSRRIARGRDLVDALRGHARSTAALRDRLSGVSDAIVVPRLRHRRRRGRLRGERRAVDGHPAGGFRRVHGRRHRGHALHRHDGAARERTHLPRAIAGGCQRGGRHRGLRAGAVAGGWPRPAPAPAAVGMRARHGHRRHALHRHGGADADAL